MSALDELHFQCERRGWRIALTAAEAESLSRLEVVGVCMAGTRELLASVPTGDGLERAAVALAESLVGQGLIA